MCLNESVIRHCINRLERMGYNVGYDFGSGDVDTVCVSLVTDSGQFIITHLSAESFTTELVVDELVGQINRHIKKEF